MEHDHISVVVGHCWILGRLLKDKNSAEVCRVLDFLQEDLDHSRSSALESHIRLFADGAENLYIDNQLRWELWSGYELTEKFPVAYTLSFLNVDVRSTSRETECPWSSLLGSMNQTPESFLFEA